jgi:hypothetical protein
MQDLQRPETQEDQEEVKNYQTLLPSESAICFATAD